MRECKSEFVCKASNTMIAIDSNIDLGQDLIVFFDSRMTTICFGTYLQYFSVGFVMRLIKNIIKFWLTRLLKQPIPFNFFSNTFKISLNLSIFGQYLTAISVRVYYLDKRFRKKENRIFWFCKRKSTKMIWLLTVCF